VDIFAAGIILYELLTKQKPFPRATDVESLVQSRKSRVLAPTAIDDRLPRELDPILMRALAYDPEDRFPDARTFADALVDVLFPTPHSAIQDLLGRQMHQVYAERITRQRAARAHDALVMKVLRHVAEQQKAAAYERVAQAMAQPAGGPPVPLAELPSIDLDVDRTDPSRAAPRAAERIRTIRVGAGRAVALGALAGTSIAAGIVGAAVWFRPGLLLVTSSPPGAQVLVDGRTVHGGTPAAVEGLRFSQAHRVKVVAPGHKDVERILPAEVGAALRRLHVDLPTALGALVVESDPPGAEVRLDGQAIGTTPVTVLDQRLDERHRIDLVLAGHEIDQFVVLPERDGTRFKRKLSRRGAGGSTRTE